MAATLFDGTAEERQWQLHHMQLINWGTFDGASRVDFACDFKKPAVTVICGESGTGKSTMQDAYDEVMMRSARYNAASNVGGRGKGPFDASGKRTLVTYVRGMVDSVYDDETGEQVARALRDDSRACWTAIGAVFVDSLGNFFTAARAYYLTPGAGTIDRDNTWYITANEDLDLTGLDQVAGRKFDKRSIASALPRTRQHEGRKEFLDCVYRSLGIGDFEKGNELMHLLAKVRAGKEIDSVSALFRELVLDKPATYEAADKAIEEFDNHTKVYEKLRRSAEQHRMLEPIVGHKKAFDQALALADLCEDAGSLDNRTSPLAVWLKGRQAQVVAVVQASAEDDRRAASARLEDARRLVRETAAEVKQLEARVEEAGGGKLTTLEARIESAREEYARRKAAYERLAGDVAGAGLKIPQVEEDYEHLVAHAKGRLGESDARLDEAEKERDLLVVQNSELEKEAQEVRGDLDYYGKHRSNIPRRLSEARDKMAAAAGMAPEDLPFAAELMEVTKGEEQWRQAIEIVLRPLACSVLVDKKQLAHFRRCVDAIDAKDLGVRVHHHGVDLEDSSRRHGRAGGIAEKVELDPDSLFAPWLSRVLADENHDALCVERPDDLRGDDLRVTRAGQTSQGLRGAHGRGAAEINVIGFSNEATVALLTRRLVELEGEAARLHEEIELNLRRRQEAQDLRVALQSIIKTPFAEVDAAGARSELAQLQREREEFLLGNVLLGELKGRLSKARELWEELVKAEGAEVSNVKRAEERLVVLKSEADSLAGAVEAAHVLSQEVAAHIEKIACDKEDSYDETRDLHKNFREFAHQVDAENKSTGAKAALAAESEKNALEGIFTQFQSRWNNPNLGTGIDSYDEYAVILEELVYQNIGDQEDLWKAQMLTWIRADLVPLRRAFELGPMRVQDKIVPINAIFSGLPFGADGGRLRLSAQLLESSLVKEFGKELGDYARSATLEGLPENFDAASFCDAVGALLNRVRPGSPERDVLLDRRRCVEVTAKVSWPAELGRKDSCYNSLAGKSGGEVQELVAFLSASALLYKQGGEAGCKPVFAPVMLDEGFCKADSKFTARAVAAWKGFGFQLLVATPQNMYQSFAKFIAECAYMTKGADGVSRVTQVVLEEGEARA